MGVYINLGNEVFSIKRNGEYVDKTALISTINRTIKTERCFSCVTRPRRFGKSLAAHMLCAYYDESCDSRYLFSDLKISDDPSFEMHLNKYPVIYLDITDFTSRYGNDSAILSHIQDRLISDIIQSYCEVAVEESDDLMEVLIKVCHKTGKSFIMIIDEWDAILREYSGNGEIIDQYVNFLRRLFKGSNSQKVFAAVYMTGILPVKKYKTESALNNFEEYSIINPADMANCFGFTSKEVELLAKKYNIENEELKTWYDGYRIGNLKSVYNPYSVIKAVQRHNCTSYWSSSGNYESVKTYIQMNFDGLKDDVVKMLAGGICKINPDKFQNDMSVINSKDDVFTVLIHLGYLAYNCDSNTCYIPNREISEVFSNAVEETSWKRLSDTLIASQKLVESTLNHDEEAVARCVDLAHDENTSILSYNDENSLACVLTIAYYYANKDYIIHREFASGKGFAVLVLIHRKNIVSPALIVELKVDKTPETAINQICQREYFKKLSEYSGDILLVGITYDRKLSPLEKVRLVENDICNYLIVNTNFLAESEKINFFKGTQN